MKTIKVAWGLVNSENAQQLDPLAEKDIKQFGGEDMYSTYSFKTQEEVDAFKLAVSEMDCHLVGYIVQIK